MSSRIVALCGISILLALPGSASAAPFASAGGRHLASPDNPDRLTTNVCGTISTNTTWTLAASPYVVTCNTTVAGGVTLVVQAGVEIRFNPGTRLTLNGVMNSVGAETNRIILTSSQAARAAGDWSTLSFQTGSAGSQLRYVTIEYGSGITIAASPIILEHILVQNNRGTGIYMTAPTTVSHSQVINNDNSSGTTGGIYVYCTNALIENSEIAYNRSGTRGGGIHGYGYCGGSFSLTLRNNAIHHNSLGSYCGGGVLFDSMNGEIVNNAITDNTVTSGGGGGICAGGASRPNVAIRGNYIARNSAASTGGGVGTDSFTTIESNSIVNNSVAGQYGGLWYSFPPGYGAPSSIPVRCNRITGNRGQSGVGNGVYSGAVTPLHDNVIRGNEGFQFEVGSASANYIENNYWGTTDSAAISAMIFDRSDNPSRGLASFLPPSSSPPSCAPSGPDQSYGQTTSWQAFAADPVNTASGNYTYAYVDIAVASRSRSLDFSRTYNSAEAPIGALGFGWTHSYEVSVTNSITGVISIYHGDGRKEAFTWNGTGYDPPPGTFSTFTTTNGLHRLTLKDQTVYDFNAQGNLATITDRNGHMTTLTYSGSQLTTVGPPARSDCNGDGTLNAADISATVLRVFGANGGGDPVACDANGDDRVDAGDLSCTTLRLFGGPNACPLPPDGLQRRLTLSYDGQGRVSSVQDHTGRTVTYGYSTAGDLTTVTDVTGAVTTYTYDANHRILTLTDANNHTFVTNVYDSDARVVDQADALGRHTAFSYDTVNRRTTVTDPLTRTTRYDYDADMRLIGVVDAQGRTESYTYDADFNRRTTTDRRGGLTSYAYDARGNVLRVTDTLGNARVLTYDARNNLTSDRDARGNLTAYVYDAAGNLLSRTNPMGAVTSFGYDRLGRISTSTDALGRVTSFGHDFWSARTTITDAVGGVATSTYDAAGRKTADTDPLGRTASYGYDAADRVLVITNALGAATRYQYDAVGNRTRITDTNGHATVFSYTPKDQLGSVTDPLGHPTTFLYDQVGNQTQLTDPMGRATVYGYDSLNRRITVTDANSNTVSYGYDAVGNRTVITDALSHTTLFTYNLASRLTGVRDAATGVVSYTYDASGNRTSLTDANGHATAYAYDSLNRLVAVTDALGAATTYVYDAVGNRTAVNKPDGIFVQVAYDPLDRPVQTTAPSISITNSYDTAGNRLSQSDATGTTLYQYDALDRLIRVDWPDGRVVQYGYDSVGNRTQLTYPGGNTVTYQFDNADRMTQFTDWNTNTVQYAYDAASAMTAMTLPNGTATTYAYDAGGRPMGITHRRGATVLGGFGYAYNAIDDRLSETTGAVTTTYSYDVLHRLIGGNYPGGTNVTYAYDPMGNRTSMTRTGSGTTNYSYDVADRLLTAGSATMGWDANGRQTSRVTGGVTTTYLYDPLDRLLQVSDGMTSTTLTYNGDGVRVGKSTNGNPTMYLQDAGAPLPVVLVETTSGQDTRYLYGPGLVGVVLPGGTYRWQHADALGSIRLQTDGAGNVVATRDYDAFGEARAQTGAWIGSLGFAAEQRDGETGLMFLRARYTDSSTGRFLDRDPHPGVLVDSQSLNRYVTALNQPTMQVDRDGKFVLALIVGAIIVYKAADAWQTFIERAEQYESRARGYYSADFENPEWQRRYANYSPAADYNAALKAGVNAALSTPGTSLGGPPPGITGNIGWSSLISIGLKDLLKWTLGYKAPAPYESGSGRTDTGRQVLGAQSSRYVGGPSSSYAGLPPGSVK